MRFNRALFPVALITLNALLGVFSLAGRPAGAQGRGLGYRSAFRYPFAVAPQPEMSLEEACAVAHRLDPRTFAEKLRKVNRPRTNEFAALKGRDRFIPQNDGGPLRDHARPAVTRTFPGAGVSGKAAPAPRGPIPVSPDPDVEFDSLTDVGYEPADAAIAGGPAHVMTASNITLKVHQLNGNPVSTTDLNTFFPLDTTGFIFDPRLCYDPATDRFILVSVSIDDVAKKAFVQLAVSKTSDPSDLTNGWYRYEIEVDRPGTGDTEWGDYPSVGYDSQAIYLSFNMFPFTGSTGGGNRVLILDKSKVTNGQPVTPVVIDDILEPAPLNPVKAFTIKPVESMGTYGPGGPGLMISLGENTYGFGQGLSLFKISNPLGSGGPPVVTASFIDPGVRPLIPNDAPQAGTTRLVATNDERLQKAVILNGVIWTCNGASTTLLGKAQCYFYRVNPSGAGSLLSLRIISDPTRFYWFPAIVPDFVGNAIAVFAGSDATSFPAMYHARLDVNLGTFNQTVLTEPSASAFLGGRWGDYSDASPDPSSSGGRIWTHAMLSTGPLSWKTHVARVAATEIPLLTPNGRETFLVGETVFITWKRIPGNTTIPLDLTLSRDGGATFKELIASGIADTGLYVWTATGPTTTNARIRVSISGVNFGDASDEDFQIVAGFKTTACTTAVSVSIPDNFKTDADWVEVPVTFPIDQIIGGLDVRVDITHSFVGDLQLFLVPPDVREAVPDFSRMIMLLDTTRQRQVDLHTSFPAPTKPVQPIRVVYGRHSRPTDPLTGQPLPWRLRVRDLNRGDVGTLDNVCLTVAGMPAPQVTVFAPNGGERVATGSQLDISWESSAVTGNVEVGISRDSGATYTPIQTVPTAAFGFTSVNWTVTGPPTKHARIRVQSLSDPVALDFSDADFEIVDPFLTIQQPNGGERISTGRPYVIQWDDEPREGTVTIERSLDGGATWAAISTTAPDIGSYTWTPAVGEETDQALIRITQNPGSKFALGVPLTDTSDAVFTIETPSVRVISPNGGELWYTGTMQTITWTSVAAPGNVNIDLFRNGAWEPLVVDTPNDGSETITVTGPAAVDARVRVSVVSDPTLTDVSDNPFDIREMTITVQRPNGGEVIGIGFPYSVRWDSDGVPGNVDLALSRDNGATFEPLASDIANTGSLDLTFTGPATSQAILRISAVGFPAADVSDSAFSLVDPTITVIAANGGEELRVGRPFTITWSSVGIPASTANTVDIDLSRDGGSTWESLFTATPNDGSETWTVTGPDTTTALFRISLSSDPAISDTSDGAFRIVTPKLTVLSPNGGEIWVTGTAQTIRWSSIGIDGTVNVELTRDGGSTWETLFSNADNSGSVNWTVTEPGSTNARVRVTPLTRTDLADESDGPFTILSPSITVGTPNGGEEWLIGTTQTITWASRGIPPDANVDVELSRDGGGSWTTLMTTRNDGSEAWTVTGGATTNAFVRITWVDRRSVSDTSNRAFSIVEPTLVVTSPGSRTKWKVGTRQTITWSGTVLGAGGTVDIYLSRNNGNTFTKIIEDTANDGSAAWLVTNPKTGKAKIKVVWRPIPGVQGVSPGHFRIVR